MSVAITSDGQVYVWGMNKKGCLGFTDGKDVPFPRALGLKKTIVEAACGDWHYMLLTNEARVYGVGHNK